MDPNANLAEQRRLVARISSTKQGLGADAIDALRLVELVDALDSWIMNGGALPRAWKESR